MQLITCVTHDGVSVGVKRVCQAFLARYMHMQLQKSTQKINQVTQNVVNLAFSY